MNFNKIFKKLETTHIVVIIAGLALVYALYNYSQNKATVMDGMKGEQPAHVAGETRALAPNDAAAGTEGEINNGPVTNVLPEGANGQQVMDPSELLPRDENSEWATLNPMGSGDLQNVNLLSAGHHVGINTVSSSLRNASMDIRGDIPNPQVQVGPWNQTTIEPDVNRRPLEVGSSPMRE
jgi:hypothetical protein